MIVRSEKGIKGLVRFAREDIDGAPTLNHRPADTVNAGVGIALGGHVVVAQNKEFGGASLVGGRERLVAVIPKKKNECQSIVNTN